MHSPALFADPDYEGFVEMVPGVPPASRIGAQALSGRSAAELAFLAGRHLANYREEHFVKMLVPSARGLEDIFLAALSIGNPGLPLSAQVKQLVVPIANAIEPILEPAAVDRLRGHFLRFVEEGWAYEPPTLGRLHRSHARSRGALARERLARGPQRARARGQSSPRREDG
jgi:hypothetical protein